MNWKFWQIRQANEQIDGLRRNVEELTAKAAVATVQLYDPAWPAKRQAFLERLANTPEQDALMQGVMGMLDQAILMQVQRCERTGISETEAVQYTSAIGLLVGLRADFKQSWQTQLAKKANAAQQS